jgi:hypothetical protein
MIDFAGANEVVALCAGRDRCRPICLRRARSRDDQGLARCAQIFLPELLPCLLAEMAGVREHLGALDLEAFAELNIGAGDDLPGLGSPLLDGRTEPGVIERLDLAPLVDRGHDGCSGGSSPGTACP